MKTITFYSYKGGVGRSLALSNIAIRLSEYNKKVCVLDFDLEAPGLQFKFKNYSKPPKIEKGIVDYIYEFSCQGGIPDTIKKYSVVLNPANKVFKPIDFIPAGNIDSSDYWKKLSMIKWSDMFYSEEAQGIKFFLDLKNKIQKEFNPDFLLIDSRTGITDIAGITLRVLADEVVVLAANNEENIYGSKKIIKSLLDKSNSLFDSIPKINFVLTRLPYNGTTKDNEKEYLILEKLKSEFKKHLEVEDFEISVIRSDRRLEENERTLIGYDYDEKAVSISNDYLNLFDQLTKEHLSLAEIEIFKNKRNAEKEFNKSKEEKDSSKKMQHLSKAIELDSNKFEYFLNRGAQFILSKDFDKAINDFDNVLKLNPDNWEANYFLGYIYKKHNHNYDLSLEYYNRAITLEPLNRDSYQGKYYLLKDHKKLEEALDLLTYFLENVNANDDKILNSRSELYRTLGKYKEAYSDIYKAIEINSNEAYYFGTLAEIYAAEGSKEEEFYLNLTIALSKGIKKDDLNSAKDVLEKYRNEARFINLMNKYKMDIEEIFNVNLEE